MFRKILAGGATLGVGAYAYTKYQLHCVPSLKAQLYVNRDTNNKVVLDQTTVNGYIHDGVGRFIKIKIPQDATTTLNRDSVKNVETAEYETDKAITEGIPWANEVNYGKGNQTEHNNMIFRNGDIVTKKDGTPLNEPIKFYLTADSAFGHSSSTLCDGIDRKYYKDGEVLSETCYYNCRKDGPQKLYYPDGTLNETGINRDGKKKGTWVWRDQEHINHVVTIHL